MEDVKSGVESLRVIGDVGTIDVTTETRADIALEVVKQSSSFRTDLDELMLETERDGDTLEIRTVYDGELSWMESRP